MGLFLSACGKSKAASSGRTSSESAASEMTGMEITSTEIAAKEAYENSDLGIRIMPGDGFTAYSKADAFSLAVRGKKWKDAFGENNRFEFGYKVSAGDRSGWFYGYSTELSEAEQEHDLSDFVSAVELQVTDGEVQENGTKKIGSLDFQGLDISWDDGTQEVLYLTKCKNAIVTIVIGQMKDAPIEDLCMDAIADM